jgi:DDE superfamily endonuclease
VALHTVDLACRLPEPAGRPVNQWDCTELARQLVADGVVAAISAATVRRILARGRLRPWRSHLWRYPRRPRDATFLAQVHELADLYTRPLGADEVVICLDEMTALAPRPRLAPTRPAQPGRPQQVEHEYRRDGALNVLAAFNTRDGSVSAYLCRRKRHVEVLHLLDLLDGQLAATITTVHLVCDNVSTHKGNPIQTWLAAHPRFVMHYTPVHSSWMNQIEQWFSILARKRLRLPNFADLAALAVALSAFIDDWNAHCHPFRWTAASFDTVIAKVERALGLTADRDAA